MASRHPRQWQKLLCFTKKNLIQNVRMSKLPPLNSVKAFEAAARLGSFVSAALELGVTPVAVGQQVRNLESYFGKQLFSRHGNRIALTDAGQSIYPQTSRALGELSAMTVRIQESETQALLVVSVPFSIADLWLVPKLAKLFEIFPQMAIDLRVDEDPVDWAKHTIDVRISYGDFHYPELQVTPLFTDEVTPVCSPDFQVRFGIQGPDLTKVPESAFIHTHWGPNYVSHPTWSDWFRTLGVDRRPDPARGRRVGLSSLALSSARLGWGIALGQKEMARHDLEAGRLICLSQESIPLGHPYCAFVPRAKNQRLDIKRLIGLLSSTDA
jgi:LysR family glycine cleavage system transcriptional activator